MYGASLVPVVNAMNAARSANQQELCGAVEVSVASCHQIVMFFPYYRSAIQVQFRFSNFIWQPGQGPPFIEPLIFEL